MYRSRSVSYTHLDVYKRQVQPEYFADILKRQAIVNAGVAFLFKNQRGNSFETQQFYYKEGITAHVREVVGEDALSGICLLYTYRCV